MRGNLECILVSLVHSSEGKGLEATICWCRLVCINLAHGFILIQYVAVKTELEGVFLCIASVKRQT